MRKALWYLVAILCVVLVLVCTRSTLAQNILLPQQLESIAKMHTSESRCTGFIVARGVMITAGHCLHITDPVHAVEFSDGTFRPYTIITAQFISDCAHDWAVVMVDTGDRKPLKLGVAPKRNDTLYRIGYPQGFNMQVARVGSVRVLENDYIEMSNQASPGESGAPLLDAAGRVVGILDCFDKRHATALGGEVRLFREAIGRVIGEGR